METPQASLGSRQPGYMTFYRQMWDLLQNRSVSKLLMGLHAIRDGGSVWLLKEWKTPLRCIDIDSESIQIDGYVVYMPGLPQPVVAISCEGWKHCFKGALYMNQTAALQNEYVSTSSWRPNWYHGAGQERCSACKRGCYRSCHWTIPNIIQVFEG